MTRSSSATKVNGIKCWQVVFVHVTKRRALRPLRRAIVGACSYSAAGPNDLVFERLPVMISVKSRQRHRVELVENL